MPDSPFKRSYANWGDVVVLPNNQGFIVLFCQKRLLPLRAVTYCKNIWNTVARQSNLVCIVPKLDMTQKG